MSERGVPMWMTASFGVVMFAAGAGLGIVTSIPEDDDSISTIIEQRDECEAADGRFEQQPDGGYRCDLSTPPSWWVEP